MRRLGLALVLAVLALSFGAAHAQDKYPSRPIKVLVPYGPGGATDIVARLLGDEINRLSGQPFVVINKPGANGVLAIEEMARSTPDGYTLMVGNVSTNAITPLIYAKKMTVNYEKDVVAVTRIMDVPAFLLVTAKDFPPKTAAEFIAHAKANPGKVRYGTVGVGSYPHYDMAYFAKRAGLDMQGIPNKDGAAGVVRDMVRGDAQAAFLNVASTASQIEAGNIRALAVVNPTRMPDFPNVPTMKEIGYADVGTAAWNALFAPAGTPKPVLDALYALVAKALQSPELLDKFKKQNFNPAPNASVADAKVWLAGEMSLWTKITDAVPIDAGQ